MLKTSKKEYKTRHDRVRKVIDRGFGGEGIDRGLGGEGD